MSELKLKRNISLIPCLYIFFVINSNDLFIKNVIQILLFDSTYKVLKKYIFMKQYHKIFNLILLIFHTRR
jgi:hypothetical protein